MTNHSPPLTTDDAAHEQAAQHGRASSARQRSCVGCGGTEAVGARRRATARLQGEEEGRRGPLVRILAGHDGDIAVDAGDSSFGRGVYVHPDPRCVGAAASRGLAKALRAAVRLEGKAVSPESLAAAISRAFDRRFRELLATARRSRKLELGSDAVASACAKGRGHLIIVATDAAQAAQLTEVRRAVSEGRALAWETKLGLGSMLRPAARRTELVDRSDTEPRNDGANAAAPVGVVAITDARLARAIRESHAVVDSLSRASTRDFGPSRSAASRESAKPGEGRDQNVEKSRDRGSASVVRVGKANGRSSGELRAERSPRTSTKRASNGVGCAAKLRGSNDRAAESGSPDVVE